MFAALAAGILVGNVYLKHLFARYPLQNRVSGVRVFVSLTREKASVTDAFSLDTVKLHAEVSL